VLGDTGTRAGNEQTAFRPKSPYGVAKAAAISLVANYRESYGVFACSGLLFNHKSPLRPSRFATRKITAAAARIGAGRRTRLVLSIYDARHNRARFVERIVVRDEPRTAAGPDPAAAAVICGSRIGSAEAAICD